MNNLSHRKSGSASWGINLILMLSFVAYAGCSPQFNRGSFAVSSGLSAAATSSISRLSLTTSQAFVFTGNSISLTASGGVSPYTYSIVSGGGAIAGTSYTAPGSTGTVVLEVTDSVGSTATASVTVSTGLNISPTSVQLAISNCRV